MAAVEEAEAADVAADVAAEFRQEELAMAAAEMAVSSTNKEIDEEAESGDGSSNENEELGKGQESAEKEVKKPKQSRKGGIDGPASEKIKLNAARRDGRAKGRARRTRKNDED